MLQLHPCWTHFEVLPEVHFMHTICRFESWEVISPELETVCNLELKRRSYGCLKMTAQTMSGNVAPPFRNCWTHFGALYGAQMMHTICCFEDWEVKSPALQMVHDLELK